MKKLFTLLIISVIATILIAGGTSKQAQVADSTDTTAVWAEVLSIDNSRYANMGILIYNVDDTETLDWQVKGYMFVSSDSFYVIASGTALVAGSSERIEELPSIDCKITVDLKTTTEGDTTDYQIDWSLKNPY